MSDENYALAEEAIRGHRAVIDDVVSTLRTAWEAGDDPVLYLQGIAAAYGQQAAFATGGPGAAMFAIACFMLDEVRRELEIAAESVEILQDSTAFLGLVQPQALAIEAPPAPCCPDHDAKVRCSMGEECCPWCPWSTAYTEPCCEDHGLLCSVSDTGHDACCPRCPEWKS